MEFWGSDKERRKAPPSAGLFYGEKMESKAAGVEKHISLLRDANNRFLNELEKSEPMDFYPINYEICKTIQAHTWNIPLMGLSISGDLKEVINKIHLWHNSIKNWKCWESAISNYSILDALTVRGTYIESLSQYCLLQASATRERLGTIATTALHQANLQLIENYADKLESDSRGFLSRSAREKQLKKLGNSGNWKGVENFIENISKIDDDSFRKNTYNYRNLASHGIAPRIDIGETSLFKRAITASTTLVEQPNGSYQLIEDLQKKSITYGFGGTSPIQQLKAISLIESEINKCVLALNSYKTLVIEITSLLPQHEG
jgi:hypothetical protein